MSDILCENVDSLASVQENVFSLQSAGNGLKNCREGGARIDFGAVIREMSGAS